MIAFISGKILSVSDNNYIIIVNNGIGYEVYIKDYKLYVSSIDQPLQLWISYIQREDSSTLYGFIRMEQRTLFNRLLLVSGVGPKTAMLILDKYEPTEFYRLIKQTKINDKLGARVSFSNDLEIKGIGSATAIKIIDAISKVLKS